MTVPHKPTSDEVDALSTAAPEPMPAEDGGKDKEADDALPPQSAETEARAQDDKGTVLLEYRRVMGQISFIGIELGVALAIGYFGGRWLDGRFGSSPWLTIAGVLIGFAAAAMDLVRVIRRARKKGRSRSS